MHGADPRAGKVHRLPAKKKRLMLPIWHDAVWMQGGRWTGRSTVRGLRCIGQAIVSCARRDAESERSYIPKASGLAWPPTNHACERYNGQESAGGL